jgi:hypothetical protein
MLVYDSSFQMSRTRLTGRADLVVD